MTTPASDVVYTAPISGSISRTGESKYSDFLSVKDFGAVGDGTTDDTSAIQAAESAAATLPNGTSLWFPPGTYLINNNGLTKAASVNWFGAGKKASILKAKQSTWEKSLVSGETVSASIFHLGFDLASMVPSGHPSCIAINSFSGEIAYCDFVQQSIGIQVNGGVGFSIHDNTISRVSSLATMNEGIWVRAGTSTPTQYQVKNNVIRNTGTDFIGSDAEISGNVITGWGYGAGITIEQGATRLLVQGNVCSFSVGVDSVGFTPPGIENWASFSTISGNTCQNNAGAGIHSGGPGCSVIGNVCINNGQYTGAGSIPAYRVGIISRFVSSAYNGGTSIIADNLCLDTGAGTQQYGYADDGSSVGGVTLANNLLTGAVGPMNAGGNRYDFKGPKLVSNFTGRSGFSVTSMSNNGGNVVSFSGARLGDKVLVSIDQDLNGLLPVAWVSAANQVSFTFFNPSGITVTIPTFTAYVSVEKPLNYSSY